MGRGWSNGSRHGVRAVIPAGAWTRRLDEFCRRFATLVCIVDAVTWDLRPTLYAAMASPLWMVQWLALCATCCRPCRDWCAMAAVVSESLDDIRYVMRRQPIPGIAKPGECVGCDTDCVSSGSKRLVVEQSATGSPTE